MDNQMNNKEVASSASVCVRDTDSTCRIYLSDGTLTKANDVPTFREYLNAISPISNIHDLTDVQSSPMHMLIKVYGEYEIKAFITSCIVNYLEFVKVRSDMSDMQCVETAELIMEEFPHIQLETIKLFFKKMKCGQFGEDYNSMNGAKIISRLHAFYSEVMSCIDEFEYTKHEGVKRDTSTYRALKDAVGMPESLAKKLGLQSEKQKKENEQASKIRMQIIKENQLLYHSDPENAEAIINDKIETALISKGIFQTAI